MICGWAAVSVRAMARRGGVRLHALGRGSQRQAGGVGGRCGPFDGFEAESRPHRVSGPSGRAGGWRRSRSARWASRNDVCWTGGSQRVSRWRERRSQAERPLRDDGRPGARGRRLHAVIDFDLGEVGRPEPERNEVRRVAGLRGRVGDIGGGRGPRDGEARRLALGRRSRQASRWCGWRSVYVRASRRSDERWVAGRGGGGVGGGRDLRDGEARGVRPGCRFWRLAGLGAGGRRRTADLLDGVVRAGPRIGGRWRDQGRQGASVAGRAGRCARACACA